MIGEYVTCISNMVNDKFGYKYITIGRKYKIEDIDNSVFLKNFNFIFGIDTREYQIIDDVDDYNFFPIWIFKTTQELREEKLNELGI